jgi:hypothetical protein
VDEIPASYKFGAAANQNREDNSISLYKDTFFGGKKTDIRENGMEMNVEKLRE